MKLSEFATGLTGAGLPVSYRAFAVGEVPALPYLVYYETGPIVQSADNVVFHQIKEVTVELVFERKDEALEETLEGLWQSQGLFFEPQEEVYIDTEGLSVKSYSVYLY